MVNSRYDNLEVRQIGDVWWWQKKQMRQRAVVQQWQKMAATRKAGKVAKAAAEATKAEETAVDEAAETTVGEAAKTAVDEAAVDEAAETAVNGAAEAAVDEAAEAAEAEAAEAAVVDWDYFLEAAVEAEEEYWQQEVTEMAEQDVEQHLGAGHRGKGSSNGGST